jgi:hypothetical protein
MLGGSDSSAALSPLAPSTSDGRGVGSADPPAGDSNPPVSDTSRTDASTPYGGDVPSLREQQGVRV